MKNNLYELGFSSEEIANFEQIQNEELVNPGIYEKQATNLRQILEAKDIFVHEGTFHMDDVMSVALAIKLQEKVLGEDFGFGKENQIEIHRGRYKIPNDFDGIICDCFGGVFDHHGTLINYRDNEKNKDNGMASMGSLLSVVGPTLFGEKFEQVDKVFKCWDLADLQVENDFLSLSLSRKNPLRNDDMEIQFNDALQNCLYLCDVLQRGSLNADRNKDFYMDIISDYISTRKENPLDIRVLDEETMKLKIVKDNFDKKDNLEETLEGYIFAKKAIIESLESSNSSFRQILDRMTPEESKDFIFEILDTERYYTLTQKDIQKELSDTITKYSSKENVPNILIFSDFPGDVKPFDNSIFSYIITPQLDSDEIAVYAIGEKFEKETVKGAPVPRFGFPVNYQGQEKCLASCKKQLESYLGSDISQLTKKDLNKISSISEVSIEDLKKFSEQKEFNDFLEKSIKVIDTKLDFFNEYNISFIHKDGFMAVFKDIDDAIHYIDEASNNEELSRFWSYKKGNLYLSRMVDSNVITQEESDILKDFYIENARSEHNEAVLKLMRSPNVSIDKLQILDKAKCCANAISMKVENLLEKDFPIYATETIISHNFSAGDIQALYDDYNNSNLGTYRKEEDVNSCLRVLCFKNQSVQDMGDEDKKKFIEELKEESLNLPKEYSQVKLNVFNFIQELENPNRIQISRQNESGKDQRIENVDTSKITFANPVGLSL